MKEKTKKFKEEVLNEQPQAPVAAPVQADPEEVQAAQQQATPVSSQDEPLVVETPETQAPAEEAPETTPEETPVDQPETISIEMQIPTDQLAAAVAQVTGDMEAAEASPEIEAQKQSEIAATEASANTDNVIIEALSDEEKDVIREYRKYKASKLKEAEGEEDINSPAEVDEEEVMAATQTIPEEAETEEEESEVEEEINDEDEDLSDYEEMNIDEEDANDMISHLHDIFDDEEELENTADALRTSADFLDSILADDEDDEEEEDSDEEDLTDSYDNFVDKANAKGVNYSISFDSDEEEEDSDEEDFDLDDEEDVDEMQESIIYPAGSRPLNSEISNSEYDDNLVKAYESSSRARRQALANFRETMSRNKAASVNRARFNRAVSGNTRIQEEYVDPKSWKANRFEDRMEERDQLDYKSLLRNGFLG